MFLSRSDSFSPGIAGIAGDEPTPEFVAIFAEEVQNRLDSLPEDARKVVSLIMEGYKQKEIAAKTGFSIANVERKLALVRDKWGQDLSDVPDS